MSTVGIDSEIIRKYVKEQQDNEIMPSNCIFGETKATDIVRSLGHGFAKPPTKSVVVCIEVLGGIRKRRENRHRSSQSLYCSAVLKQTSGRP